MKLSKRFDRARRVRRRRGRHSIEALRGLAAMGLEHAAEPLMAQDWACRWRIPECAAKITTISTRAPAIPPSPYLHRLYSPRRFGARFRVRLRIS